MTNLQSVFQNGKAFAAFFICGDPDMESTAEAVRAAVDNGADIIELNIPFSDPTAGDASIQNANIRALAGGVTTDKIFGFIRELRKDVKSPIIISGYANVVFSYGTERFLQTCREIGVDGLIVPDVPFEEREEFMPLCEKHGVALILMVAVTSKARVTAIAKEAKGFLYIMACPGDREEELTDIMAQVRATSDVPCVVCLNGTDDSRFPAVAAKTDGVIMDAPFVEIVSKYGADAPEHIAAFVKTTKKALEIS